MVLDGGMASVPTVLSAVSGAVTTTVRITEKVFEILAVGEQTKSLLATINQVDGQLAHAKALRRQKSGLLSANEKTNIADTFTSTEEALANVAALVERARADAQVYGGQLRLNTRMHFVLKDSPNIAVSLTQLGIANQQLNAAVIILHTTVPRIVVQHSATTKDGFHPERKAPPSYEESQFISVARNRNLRKRASALAVKRSTTCGGAVMLEPFEMSEDRSESRGDSFLDVDFDRASLVDSIADSLISLPSQQRMVDEPRSHVLGRVRSRRWLDSQCGGSAGWQSAPR